MYLCRVVSNAINTIEGCRAIICCPAGSVRLTLEKAVRGATFKLSLDSGLSRAEDTLLDERDGNDVDGGWRATLEEVGVQLRVSDLEELGDSLERHARRIELRKGEVRASREASG